MNAQNLGLELGENQFSDLNQDEYRVAAGLGYKAPENFNGMPHLGEHLHDGSALPAKVSRQSRQGSGPCGSCWACSTTGSTEGAWQLAYVKLVSLSEQQLDVESHHEANYNSNMQKLPR